jgi:hypothetical protein
VQGGGDLVRRRDAADEREDPLHREGKIGRPGVLIVYGGPAVKSGRVDLAIGEKTRMFTNVRGHDSMAIVCRRWSVSTSFMLAALRVLHVDISIPLGTGSLDRAKAICASAFACVGSVVLSANMGELVP